MGWGKREETSHGRIQEGSKSNKGDWTHLLLGYVNWL